MIPANQDYVINTLDELNGLILERTDFRLDKFPQITTDSLKAIHTKKSELNVIILLNVKIKLNDFYCFITNTSCSFILDVVKCSFILSHKYDCLFCERLFLFCFVFCYFSLLSNICRQQSNYEIGRSIFLGPGKLLFMQEYNALKKEI